MYAVLASHFISFVIAQIRKDNGILDIQWPISFFIANATAIIIRVANGGIYNNMDARSYISNTLVLIWALRMTIHICARTKLGKEDRRFANVRKMLHEKGGAVLYYCVVFFGCCPV